LDAWQSFLFKMKTMNTLPIKTAFLKAGGAASNGENSRIWLAE
jgi:hypothetical protein